MPSRPKRNARTGSRLLGAELKRLRGGRSLGDIAELSRTPPLSHHVAPIAAPTLCQLETGTSMPTLSTLYTLSHVYKVSMNRLMGYVVEDRLAEVGEKHEGCTQDTLFEEFSKRLRMGEWHRALALAIHGERTATSEQSRVAWRSNRSYSLWKLGLLDEAMVLLMSCIDSRHLSGPQRFVMLRNLAALANDAGQYRIATAMSREARLIASHDAVDPESLSFLAITQAESVLGAWHAQDRVAEAEIREGLRLLASAEGGLAAADAWARTYAEVVHGGLTLAMGNVLVAEKELSTAVARAREIGHGPNLAWGCYWLGKVAATRGDAAGAEQHWLAALSVAEENQLFVAAFDCSFELFRLMRAERPTAAVKHLRRCKQLYPLLASRSPLVGDFEAFERLG